MSINNFIKNENKLYSGSAFTGPWQGESTDTKARVIAIEILDKALSRCIDEDTRTPEVMDALEFLRGHSTRKGFCDRFARALHISDPQTRWENVNAALAGIKRQFNQRF